MSLNTFFSLSINQAWHEGPPSYPTTAQKLLNAAQNPSFLPFLPYSALSLTFLAMPEFAREGELR